MFGQDTRPIPLMPEAKCLGDLFDDVAPWVAGDAKVACYFVLGEQFRNVKVNNKPKNKSWMEIGTYLNISRGAGMPDTFPHIQSLRVIPNERLINTLLNHLVFIEYDTIGFEMIVFPDRCDLYYKHNSIIGGRMLTNSLDIHGDPMAAIISLSELSD